MPPLDVSEPAFEVHGEDLCANDEPRPWLQLVDHIEGDGAPADRRITPREMERWQIGSESGWQTR